MAAAALAFAKPVVFVQGTPSSHPGTKRMAVGGAGGGAGGKTLEHSSCTATDFTVPGHGSVPAFMCSISAITEQLFLPTHCLLTAARTTDEFAAHEPVCRAPPAPTHKFLYETDCEVADEIHRLIQKSKHRRPVVCRATRTAPPRPHHLEGKPARWYRRPHGSHTHWR